LKAKGEAFEKFKQYKVLVENEIGHKIKVLQSDNGGEFGFKAFAHLLDEKRTKLESKSMPWCVFRIL
jgi:hypothetical protein